MGGLKMEGLSYSDLYFKTTHQGLSYSDLYFKTTHPAR